MGNEEFQRTPDEEARKRQTVPFLDLESGRVVRIPAAELRPGALLVRVQGIDEPVWMLAEELREGEVRHPPFDEEVREYLREIQSAFAEQRPLSLEEWEDGFRRDADPAQEIALWLHAASVYREFADEEPIDRRRADIYRVIVTCLTTSPDTIWHVLQLSVLSRPEAEQIVRRFYGQG